MLMKVVVYVLFFVLGSLFVERVIRFHGEMPEDPLALTEEEMATADKEALALVSQ